MAHDTFTTAGQLADAFRQLADALDKTPVRPLTKVWVSVGLQAVTRDDASVTDRLATVDTLAAVLDLGAPRDTAAGHYSTGGGRHTSGLNVTAYTAGARPTN